MVCVNIKVLIMTAYEFTKVSPQQLMLQVRYTKEGLPDYWLNLRVNDFTESNLHQAASDNAWKAEEFWEFVTELPEEVIPEESTGVAKARVYVNAPDHDPFNQNVSYEWVETVDAITQTWTISEKSEEEKAEYFNGWQQSLVVSMRQARLALNQAGLLSSVDDAIAAMDEPDKTIVTLEWEYASTVERLSSWVISMGAALGLTEQELDNLFVVAADL